MKVAYTLADRYAIALWLALPWAGTEEQLEALDELADAFRVDEVEVLELPPSQQRPRGAFDIAPAAGADLGQIFHAELSEAAARFVRRVFPGQPTPAICGRSKVRLLRALRAALPDAEAPAAA